MVSVALTMLFPALGVVLTRLVTREGFQMCAWCTVLAIFLSYVTIRTGSTFAAAIGHGAANGTTNGVTLFSLSGGNPSWGPCARASWAACRFWPWPRSCCGTCAAARRPAPCACPKRASRRRAPHPPPEGRALPNGAARSSPDGVYWARDEIKEKESER